VDEGFDYPALVRQALTGLVRSVLARAAESGLPGEHHFFITLRTDAPNVELSHRLRCQHPQEMTIVLQHQFWDLEVGESAFAVSLRFGGTLERLVVPFEAITSFVDPSAEFGLRLSPVEEPEAEAAPPPAPAETDAGKVVPFSPPRSKR
jgi:hypothetical protein